MDLALCTGYNLCASRRRTLRGLFFTKKSVLKMRIRYVLIFNKKCQNLIIIVDLALCTGYNNVGVMAWGEGHIQVFVVVDGPPLTS